MSEEQNPETKEKKQICEFCKKEKCVCQFLICPFHGKVNAKKTSGGKYTCPVNSCEVERSEKELEV